MDDRREFKYTRSFMFPVFGYSFGFLDGTCRSSDPGRKEKFMQAEEYDWIVNKYSHFDHKH